MRSIVLTVLVLLNVHGLAMAQGRADLIGSTYHDPVHRQRLQSLREQAASKSSAGMNRNALELYRQYNILSDSLFGKELADTVDAYEKQFNAFAAGRLKRLEEHRKTVRDSVEQRAAARSRFLGLVLKSLLALGVWLAAVFFFYRRRLLNAREADNDLQRAKSRLQASLEDADKGRKLQHEMDAEIGQLSTLSEEMDLVVNSLADVDAKPAVQKLQSAIRRETALTDDIASFDREDSEEKTSCSINDLCDRSLELSYRGHCLDPRTPFQCGISKDLERNMLPVPMHPFSTSAVLMNVLDSAFRSVKERASLEEEGYRPSVAVSTKILPRFVQVRIKDNGNGMTDELREKLMSGYFSVRPFGEGAGAGLAEARRILSADNEGELIVESEAGRGTDVYIKIFR
ncbi:MAG: hypothetical protein RL213_6 [Bacteroidota bacterium]